MNININKVLISNALTKPVCLIIYDLNRPLLFKLIRTQSSNSWEVFHHISLLVISQQLMSLISILLLVSNPVCCHFLLMAKFMHLEVPGNDKKATVPINLMATA